MIMTNYMDLLATNQPWNLIAFMVIPVVLAESLVATEFYTMFLPIDKNGNWKVWNTRFGILAEIYFSGAVLYLLTTVIPTLQWR